MGGDDQGSLKVYISLPVKIEDELQIRDLHPDIQTIQIPRQKSRRWCFLVFQDKPTLDRVVAHLRTVRIKDKKVVIRPFKKRQPRNARARAPPSENTAVQARLELLK